ncbi:hypothetical protein [Nostoc sp. ATCC 53789]|uniref:hypothetical protein n=1 Tax=Nostoc sp. ATCC 53789 TaxID=76335 RepID=UPI000DED086E|nr:hypothetical protein [Nostoc sp. ATCC 53789]QHG20890.1 hypothetical protein GJB62_34025 [Nostoc sp. ATCC 53789]RCJ15806.1 hypothetical protein A6V25_32060 [Nostoc sp. ATCC 53789]
MRIDNCFGHPPLEASGLKLQENLTLIEQSLERMEKKCFTTTFSQPKILIAKGLSATVSLFSLVRVAYQWVDKASYILNNKIAFDAAGVKQSYQQLLTEMSQQK